MRGPRAGVMQLSYRTVELPLTEPFRISRSVGTVNEVVEITIAWNDLVGYGEATPQAYDGESVVSVGRFLEAFGPELGDDPFALEEVGRRMHALSGEMAAKAGLAEVIDHRVGDAVKLIGEIDFGLDFVLVDLWKDLYVPCLEAFYPKLNPGAIVVADNMRVPDPVAARRYQDAVRAKRGITSVTLPVGSGIEISRFEP